MQQSKEFSGKKTSKAEAQPSILIWDSSQNQMVMSNNNSSTPGKSHSTVPNTKKPHQSVQVYDIKELIKKKLPEINFLKHLEIVVSPNIKTFGRDFLNKFEDVKLKKGQYKGYYVKDQKSGEGAFYDDDGNIYKGGWLKNKRHGLGF